MGLFWRRSPSQAFPPLADAYAEALHRSVFRLGERFAGLAEAWMKSEAPWTDRTGNARQTLYAEASEIPRSAVILILGHGVEYGTFLELANEGRYAIVTPALDRFIPRIERALRRLVR